MEQNVFKEKVGFRLPAVTLRSHSFNNVSFDLINFTPHPDLPTEMTRLEILEKETATASVARCGHVEATSLPALCLAFHSYAFPILPVISASSRSPILPFAPAFPWCI
jgi:hypothetical protein